MHSAPRLSLPWFLVAAPQLTDQHFQRSVVLVVDHGEHGSLGFIVNRPLGIKLSEAVGPRSYPIPDALTAWYGGPVKTDTGIILHHAEAADAAQPTPSSTSIVLTSSERTLRRLCEEFSQRHGMSSPPPLSSTHPRWSQGSQSGLSRDEHDDCERSSGVIQMSSLMQHEKWQFGGEAFEKDDASTLDCKSPLAGATAFGHEADEGPLTPYRFLIGYAGWGDGQLEDEMRQGAWIQVPYDRALLFDTPPQKMWEQALSNVGAAPRKLVTPTHTYLN